MCGRRDRRPRASERARASIPAATAASPVPGPQTRENAVFDAWEREALARIAAMRLEFEAFREREARDAAERDFRRFMDERHPGLVRDR